LEAAEESPGDFSSECQVGYVMSPLPTAVRSIVCFDVAPAMAVTKGVSRLSEGGKSFGIEHFSKGRPEFCEWVDQKFLGGDGVSPSPPLRGVEGPETVVREPVDFRGVWWETPWFCDTKVYKINNGVNPLRPA